MFEFGNVYAHTDGKYVQHPQLALWVTGNILTENWDQEI